MWHIELLSLVLQKGIPLSKSLDIEHNYVLESRSHVRMQIVFFI